MPKDKKYKVDTRKNFKIYLDFISRYKLHAGMLIFFAVFFEFKHLIDRLLFKYLVDDATSFSAGTLLLIDFKISLMYIAGVFIILSLLESIGGFCFISTMAKLYTNVAFDLKEKYFSHLLTLSHNFYTKTKTGALISRFIRGASACEDISEIILWSFIPLVVQLIFTLGSLFYFDLNSAVIMIILISAFLIYGFRLNKLQQKARSEVNDSEDNEKAMISDVFTNMDSIKYFGKENYIKRSYLKYAKIVNEKSRVIFKYFALLDSGQTFLIFLGSLLLVYMSILKVLAGTMTVGTLVFIYTTYTGFLWYLYSFVNSVRKFYKSIADFDSLTRYSKVRSEIKDKTNAKKLEIKHGKIEFKNVYFKYKNKDVLTNFNLTIHPNEKVALVGLSGSGKSTLIKLLYRLYDINYGDILIDGESIRSVKQESLRSELSIVPQECVLFDDTIYNNILFSNPSSSYSEVMLAIKHAQLEPVIKKLPKKENTIVGERGVKLSGGEKQRVSIARAILADKKVLILDEATSALDSKTEHEIQESLLGLLNGRTSIIIAHRLSTIMKCDRIIVLDKGKIAQVGKHEELIKDDGLYQKLWRLQKGGYIK